MSEVLESEYKGNAMLVIRFSSADKFPFQFGLRKAKMIVDHIDDIRKFIQKHDQ